MFTKVVLINNEVFNKKRFNVFYNIVTQERKNKIDSYYSISDKRNSLAVFVLALFLLKENQIAFENLYFKNDKPLIKNNEFFISFSHSEDYAAVALSNDICGVDIERMNDCYLRIKNVALNKREMELLNNGSDKKFLFYDFWTKKECLIKASGNYDIQRINIFDIVDNFSFKTENIDNYVCNTYYNEKTEYSFRKLDIQLLEELLRHKN